MYNRDATKGSEHVDWSIMGPIYKDQCEALKRLVEEYKELIFKLGKESIPTNSQITKEEKANLLTLTGII